MAFGTSIFLLLVLLGVVGHYWRQIFLGRDPHAWRRFWIWASQGLLAPALVWLLLNLGLSSHFPPLILEIGLLQASGGPWFSLLLELTGPVLWAIGSSWAAVTFAWLVMDVISNAKEPKDSLTVLAGWSILTLPIALLVLFGMGWPGLGLAVSLWLAPALHGMIPDRDLPVPKPSYHKAALKMKFGKYNEAEWEVIQELEKFEDDVEGWLLLAELYALHFHDLSAAAQTVRDVCEQPNATLSQVAVACHRLADWHLKLADDPQAAHQALEVICHRAPGSHLDLMARQRIAQLPATSEELREQRERPVLRLPGFRHELDETKRREPELTRPEAAARANQCVELLRKHPNDVPVREEFARLLAEPLGKFDLAFEQLELLLAMPNLSPEKTAEWLSVKAVWQLRHRKDRAAAQQLWERVARDYPDALAAGEARRRLNFMALEDRRAGRAPGEILAR